VAGVVFAFGACWACGVVFGFDPERVPSVPIDPVTNRPPDMGGNAARAVSQPICRRCLDETNERRAANGRPLWRVLPGAYADEPGYNAEF
jgi:hypothetical protein